MIQEAITIDDHGKSVVAMIDNLEVEGTLSVVEKYGGLYAHICHDDTRSILHGNEAFDKCGHEHSWIIVEGQFSLSNQLVNIRNCAVSSIQIANIIPIENRLLSASAKNILRKINVPLGNLLLEMANKPYDKTSIRNISIRRNHHAFSYLPIGKEPEMKDTESGERWGRSNRQEMKYGKLPKKLIDTKAEGYNEKDIEEFVNLIKGENSDGDFYLVKGEDIRKWYNGDKYHNNTGSLYGSCMKHDHCQDYFDIYVFNPEVCQMLILVKDEKLEGRALLWTTGEGKFLDRIYGSDSTIEKFKMYAIEKEWNIKKYQSYDDRYEWVKPNGDEFTKYIQIDVNTDHNRWPYMDTFCYISDGSISNDSSCQDKGKANETSGYLDAYNENEYTCEGCGCDINEDYVVFVDGYGDYCEDCVIYDQYAQRHIREVDSVRLTNGTYTHVNNEEIVQLSNGDYAHIDDTCYCEYMEEHYSDRDLFVEIDGRWVHEDNVEDACKEWGFVYDQETGEYVEKEEEEVKEEISILTAAC